MDFVEEIKKLKREKKAIILTHCYQNIEIDNVSDYVGDSLYLSKVASKTDSEIIVFSGVYFMAQSAKLLSPSKKVLIPDISSNCLMANMINVEKLRNFKNKHPNIPVVCYINSTAEVKAQCDICCTSSNVVDVVKALNCEKILFVPDKFLGSFVQSKLPEIEVITFDGFCPTHSKIKIDDVNNARDKYPDAIILAHPECSSDVVESVDFVGSTKEIMEFIKNSDKKRYVIATEKGVVDRLKRDYSNKEFILINDSVICPDMKKNTLENIYEVLLNETNEIKIDSKIASDASLCIKRMIDILN